MGDNNLINCSQCNKTFVKKGNLDRHLKKGHDTSPRTRNVKKFKCPLCGLNNSIADYEQFKIHVLNFHGVSLQLNFFKFTLQSRFLAWKRKVENQTKSCYVQDSRIFKKEIILEVYKPSITNRVGVIIYNCHRSGYFRLHKDESERKRKFKSQGSAKINAFCPSRISAEFKKNGTVKVVYCSTHIGHECEVAHLRLTEYERKEIATKIAAKVPFDVILDEIRTSAGSSITRKNILCKSDLQKIKRSLFKKGDQSVLLVSKTDQDSNVEFSTNCKVVEDMLANQNYDEIAEFEDSEIQTYNPNDPDSDSELLSCIRDVENEKSHYDCNVTECQSGITINLTNNKYRNSLCSKFVARKELNDLAVSQRQNQVIEKFCSNVICLQSLKDIKWVENHINRMFIVLKSIQERSRKRKKDSYNRPEANGKQVSQTSDSLQNDHSTMSKIHDVPHESTSKLFSVSTPNILKPQTDFQIAPIIFQPALKNGQQTVCHSAQQNVNNKKDIQSASVSKNENSCSLEMKQYLVPIAGEPDKFLIVQTKPNEPPPIGPLTPINPNKNQLISRNLVNIDHNYSLLGLTDN